MSREKETRSKESEGALEVLSRDPKLAELVEEHGLLEIQPADDIFERLVVSVIRQQVSMSSARAIRERVFERFEVTPESIIEVEENELMGAGLSSQKAEYVKNISEAFVEKGYDKEYFSDMSDEEVREELVSIKGVGDWTIDMFLMFALGRDDVFPVGDLGIRKGMRELYGSEKPDGSREMSRKEMVEKAEEWEPYRSYASLYIWRSYED